jgi:hypothetical protein
MNYMEQGIEFEAKMGDGSNVDQGFMGKYSAGKPMITGSRCLWLTLLMTELTNDELPLRHRFQAQLLLLIWQKSEIDYLSKRQFFVCSIGYLGRYSI